jgi:uncharacterized membrane protein YcaP (DUF421 family)
MFIVLIRTAILYVIVVVTMRLMGKKQIGQLEPFELAIAIMISELASLPMQDTRIPIMHGIIPIITLLLLQSIMAILELKSEKLTGIINGKPSILIKDGKIDIAVLRCQKFNLNDLMEELRLQGYYNIADVYYAILETSGQLSVIPRTELSNATKKDMNIQVTQDTLPVTIILDGKINYENLNLINKDKEWLSKMLKKNSLNSPEEVFIAILDSQGKLYCQSKYEDSKGA